MDRQPIEALFDILLADSGKTLGIFFSMGEDDVREIMRHPAFAEVPFLLEVPGLDGKGPDEENVNRLKRIRDGEPEPAETSAGG